MDTDFMTEDKNFFEHTVYKSCLNCNFWKNKKCNMGKSLTAPDKAFCIRHELKY